MDKICRLCLSFAEDDILTVSFHNNDILRKIRLFSSLEILVQENLPNKICTTCEAKVDHCYDFYLMIKENQLQLLNNIANEDSSSPDKFFNSLKSSVKTQDANFKLEDVDSRDFIKIPSSKSLESSTNINRLKTEVSNEENLDGNTDYSSGDDISLSTIKLKAYNDQNFHPNLSRLENIEWKCLTCEKPLVTRELLLEHYKKVHGSEDNKIFETFTRVSTSNGDVYQCTVCKKIYDKKKDVKRHMISHVKQRPYNCSICGRKYKTAADILWHARAHYGGKTLTCSEGCGFRTVYRTALLNHENRHKTQFKFTCEQCGKGFQVRTWFEQHRNVHTGARPYVCSHCGKCFPMERYLAAHCSRQHAASETAQRHYCVHCAFTCGSRHALTQHLKEHGVVASFLCDICGKSLATAEYLKFHRRTHLGEKPYSCGTCSKAFVKKCNLTLHERTHSGEKPHVCAKCGKAFSQKGTLVLHTRSHTGVRPYQCTKCPKAFVSKSQLTSHQKTCV